MKIRWLRIGIIGQRESEFKQKTVRIGRLSLNHTKSQCALGHSHGLLLVLWTSLRQDLSLNRVPVWSSFHACFPCDNSRFWNLLPLIAITEVHRAGVVPAIDELFWSDGVVAHVGKVDIMMWCGLLTRRGKASNSDCSFRPLQAGVKSSSPCYFLYMEGPSNEAVVARERTEKEPAREVRPNGICPKGGAMKPSVKCNCFAFCENDCEWWELEQLVCVCANCCGRAPQQNFYSP